MADGAAATARLVDHGQARRAVLVELPTRRFNRLLRVTTRRSGSHDLRDRDFGSPAIISRHAATHITLGDDAGQLETIGILDDGRAAAA